ncbi:hypothetical protein PR048_005178 [Dryococelus australis]|uniref:Uncharacterized protein n=1 Tax=Dryococelus australis TaxID=614101 RepID=A0ABQ9I7Z6_9NEOP|nr:hypothetical protein PR048_005178 [Dryococelus australis]
MNNTIHKSTSLTPWAVLMGWRSDVFDSGKLPIPPNSHFLQNDFVYETSSVRLNSTHQPVKDISRTDKCNEDPREHRSRFKPAERRSRATIIRHVHISCLHKDAVMKGRRNPRPAVSSHVRKFCSELTGIRTRFAQPITPELPCNRRIHANQSCVDYGVFGCAYSCELRVLEVKAISHRLTAACLPTLTPGNRMLLESLTLPPSRFQQRALQLSTHLHVTRALSSCFSRSETLAAPIKWPCTL